VQVANGANDLPRCIAEAVEFDDKLIAERWIAGREFTVALLGRNPLPMIEIVSPQTVFTYDAKYASSKTVYRFDIELPSNVVGRLYNVAVAAARALGTAGLVRVDLMLDRNHEPWVLELNTIPGMTARSMAPRAAAAAGIDMPALVNWMVRDALRRHREPVRRTVENENELAPPPRSIREYAHR
jgi:D-alanine-D-alanine ligase